MQRNISNVEKKIHDPWRGKPWLGEIILHGLKAGTMDIDIYIVISNLDTQSLFVCLGRVPYKSDQSLLIKPTN